MDGFVCKWVSAEILRRAQEKHKSISWKLELALSVCLLGNDMMSVGLWVCLWICLWVCLMIVRLPVSGQHHHTEPFKLSIIFNFLENVGFVDEMFTLSQILR